MRNGQQEANDAPPLYHFRRKVILLWKTSFCLHRMRRVAKTLQEQYRSVTLELFSYAIVPGVSFRLPK